MKFSFGQNWLSYSSSALDQEKIASAREGFRLLTRGIELRNARFLDVGFGQGLALFFAAEAGADVYGIDVDPVCAEALKATHRFFPDAPIPHAEVASILDDHFVRDQKANGGFDVVYSWGVLHHSGDMLKAFRNAAQLVKERGFLVISIYNRHWTAPWWRAIKYIFNQSPRFLQQGMVSSLYPVFYLRARSLEPEGPVAERGMDLRHDIRDWLGGYPYEFASQVDVQNRFSELGFRMLGCVPTKGFTGCNEFVFQKE